MYNARTVYIAPGGWPQRSSSRHDPCRVPSGNHLQASSSSWRWRCPDPPVVQKWILPHSKWRPFVLKGVVPGRADHPRHQIMQGPIFGTRKKQYICIFVFVRECDIYFLLYCTYLLTTYILCDMSWSCGNAMREVLSPSYNMAYISISLVLLALHPLVRPPCSTDSLPPPWRCELATDELLSLPQSPPGLCPDMGTNMTANGMQRPASRDLASCLRR
jgi:hypothetical protein